MAFFRIDQIMHEFDVHELAFKVESVMNHKVALTLEIISVFGDSCVPDHASEVFRAAFCDHAAAVLHYCSRHLDYACEHSRLIAFGYNGTSSFLLSYGDCFRRLDYRERELLLFLDHARLHIAKMLPQ